MPADSVSTRLYPAGMLNTLSRHEVERLTDASRGDLASLLRRCALAVLNSGSQGDDAEAMLARYHDFAIEVQQVNRGLRLQLTNAPGIAFVDGRIIVAGGEGSSGPNGVFTEVEAFEPTTNTWFTLAPLPVGRHGTGAASIDGVFYLPGGAEQEAFGAVATVQKLTL